MPTSLRLPVRVPVWAPLRVPVPDGPTRTFRFPHHFEHAPMIVFRWIMGVLGGLLAAGSVLSFVLFVTLDVPLWLTRARSLRRGVYTVALFWFNVEVWGRVLWTLLHWNRPSG